MLLRPSNEVLVEQGRGWFRWGWVRRWLRWRRRVIVYVVEVITS